MSRALVLGSSAALRPMQEVAAAALDALLPETAFRRALGWLLALNAMDALFTLMWVQALLATEANPVMAWALEHGPVHFLLAKCALVTGGVAVLWAFRERWVARLGVVPPALLYSAIAGLHLGYALLYFTSGMAA